MICTAENSMSAPMRFPMISEVLPLTCSSSPVDNSQIKELVATTSDS